MPAGIGEQTRDQGLGASASARACLAEARGNSHERRRAGADKRLAAPKLETDQRAKAGGPGKLSQRNIGVGHVVSEAQNQREGDAPGGGKIGHRFAKTLKRRVAPDGTQRAAKAFHDTGGTLDSPLL